MTEGQIAIFDLKKSLKYIEKLGFGGTGDTHLFLDETTNILFAVKKYVPKGANDTADTYRRFVDEIKILYNLSHPNIVRIYNYYLYPEEKTGYIQMEYIKGDVIDKYLPINRKCWNDVFKECISAFVYLESHGILHRDIRPSNIMIDKDDVVKVIDFGFGKILMGDEVEASSILLNWPATERPQEIETNGKYSHRTEMYYLGKLFSKLPFDKDTIAFDYSGIIEKMIKVNPDDRFASFLEISQTINEGAMIDLHFTTEQKLIYKNMICFIVNAVCKCDKKFNSDPYEMLAKLAEVLRENALEEFILDTSKLFRCFFAGGYEYYASNKVKVDDVSRFYQFLKSLTTFQQKVVIENFITRLVTIDDKDDEELPF